MSVQFRHLGFIIAPLALGACLAAHETPILDVDATIASVTLADDCTAAADEPGRASGIAADCDAEDDCGGYCRQSAISLAIEAEAEGPSVPFEVISIRAYNMDGGAFVQELSPYAAQIFVDGVYGPWDEQIDAGAILNIRYDTTELDWPRVDTGAGFRLSGVELRIEMVVRIDGIDRTLEFSPVTREPEIVT